MEHGGKRQGAGRPKGSVAKRTQAMLDAIEEHCPGYDPVVSMAIIANDETKDENLRIQCHKEVAQYIHAKRKAVESSVTLEGELGVRGVSVNGVKPTDA